MPGMKDAEAQPALSCAVEMSDRRPCGRPIHPAPEHDERPVCLMHSRDPAKSDEAFQEEFERILAEAERTRTVANFCRFVFPSSGYSERTFAPACHFGWATFTQYANFYHSTFTQDAYFWSATFIQCANFIGATFTQDARFNDVTFSREVDKDADFSGATFKQDAYFGRATFIQGANFIGATFTKDAHFEDATFSRRVYFSHAKLRGAARFRETHFRHDFTNQPGLVFNYVKIEHPEQVEFHTTDLGQALFYNTDVSKVDFRLVTWHDRGPKARKERRRSSSLCIFDEDVNLENHPALRRLPGSADERNYGLIAETYQQLKRNYDAKGDYWTAGHWHYGEMEMKRLHSRCRFRPLRWLSHHFSLAALYKYASAYGESYMLPLVWLAGVLVFFTLAYPLLGFYPTTGLELNAPGGACQHECLLNYWNYHVFFNAHPAEHPSGFWGMMLHSAMTSLSVAGFQRELRYTPSYPWGRMQALLELLLTTTLAGLFALAIRRQFKRS